MSSNVTKLPHAEHKGIAPHPLSLQAAMERAAEARLKTALIAGGVSVVWIVLCLIYEFQFARGAEAMLY